MELETQLQHEESKSKELRMQSNRLQLENEQLRDKLEQCSRDYHFQVMGFFTYSYPPLP